MRDHFNSGLRGRKKHSGKRLYRLGMAPEVFGQIFYFFSNLKPFNLGLRDYKHYKISLSVIYHQTSEL